MTQLQFYKQTLAHFGVSFTHTPTLQPHPKLEGVLCEELLIPTPRIDNPKAGWRLHVNEDFTFSREDLARNMTLIVCAAKPDTYYSRVKDFAFQLLHRENFPR